MKNFFLVIMITFFSLLAYSSLWGVKIVGNIEFEKIYFHLFMPLKGAHTDWMQGIWISLVGGGILTAITGFCCCYILKDFKRLSNLLFVILLSLILFDCWFINKHFKVYDFFKSSLESSDFIEKNYVSPDLINISFPTKKKNLIIIMAESLETSYQNKENGGLFDNNYIPELTTIAKQNISFSSSDKIEGAFVAPETGWTIAATVAYTAGIPLKLYGSIDTDNKERWIDNKMNKYKYFLPGAVTLGDILTYNGYKNYFILGTYAGYAGKANYLKQHGNYEIMDCFYFGNNGTISDKDLFKLAKKQISKISQTEPFSVLIQTIDTHFAKKEDYKNLSKEIYFFVKWLKHQSFFKDTVILIVGDHCNMRQEDFHGLENENFRYNGNIKRKVYNVFINSNVIPQKSIYRKFSTMDMFPTILAAIGAKIENEHLGLGVNLFSEEKTLMEKYNPEWVFQELKKKSNWYNHTLLSK